MAPGPVGWAAAIALCVGAGGAWWLASATQSPEQAAARASEPPASWVTAEVEFRVLSATLIQRGDVRAEISVSVVAPSSVGSTAVITRRLVEPGDRVDEGERVIEVSGRPVFVLRGDVPMYRSLRPGMVGADVAQLQAALARLGHQPETDGIFGPATKDAVTSLYVDAGYAPLPAFDTAATDLASADQAITDARLAVAAAEEDLDNLGDDRSGVAIAQAQASRQQAERTVESARSQRLADVALAEDEYNAAIRTRDRLAADGTTAEADVEAAALEVQQAGTRLDAIRRTSADAVTSAEEALWVATLALGELESGDGVTVAQQELAAALDTLSAATNARDAIAARNGPTIALGEVVFLPQFPARVRSAAVSIDATVETASTALVELSSGVLVVGTSVRPSDGGLVRVGMAVQLLDERTATAYPATVRSVAEEPVLAADGQLGHPVTITPDESLPDGLTGANLRVTITAASTGTAVLVVPLAAVTSAADGTTRVSVVTSPNDTRPIDVVVDAGMSADGFVAIEPIVDGQIEAGDAVVVGT